MKLNKSKKPNLTTPLESATRKKIDIILHNLGWKTDEASGGCNVFTERPKTRVQQEILKGKQPDYVLYGSEVDIPLAIIEAKRSGQSLSDALQQAIALYAKPLNIDIVFVTDGTLVETHDRRTNDNLYIDDQLVTEFLAESLILKFIEQGSRIYVSEKFAHTKRELIDIFKGANELLRKEGMREGIERFTEFSNLLFLKLISEIERDREENGEPRILAKRFCWEAFCNKEAEEMLDYINKIILPKLVNQYNHSGDVFQNELAIKNAYTLNEIVDKLSELKLLDTDSDIKGDAFEYFLKNSVSVGTDLGEYFTPRHIVKLMVDLVSPVYGNKVYDPCCGTGGFLIEAFRHIKRKCKPTSANIRRLKEKTIYGRELTATAKIAKMNMIIIGDGHTNIQQEDSLKNPIKNVYETILTNFPFSQKTDYSNYYGFVSQDANPVFLKHVIDALSTGGKAGVVVPDGLLFDKKSEYKKIRRILLETCEVFAVIQLHTFVFRPYTGQPTSILIFKKGNGTKKVWFFDVTEDGFKKTGSKKGRPIIDKNDLILLRQLWDEKAGSNNSFSVDFDTIKNKNYKLNLNAYTLRPKRKIPTVRLGSICDIEIGGTPSTKKREYWTGDTVWLTITDMNSKNITSSEKKITNKAIKESSVKILPQGTLLFSFKLTVGKVAFAGCKLCTNEAIAALIPKDKSDKTLTHYLYYILPKLDFSPYAQRAAKGYTLNKDSIGDIEIPFPKPEKRKELVSKIIKAEERKNTYFMQIKEISKKQNLYLNEYLL